MGARSEASRRRKRWLVFLSHCRYVGARIRTAFDGADFLLWQRDGADEAAYAEWLGNFWSPLTPLTPAATEAVPEPAGTLLALAALALPFFARRRSR